MRGLSASLSIVINRVFGGLPGENLCARIARRYGANCWFCRLIGMVLLERDHCARQIKTEE